MSDTNNTQPSGCGNLTSGNKTDFNSALTRQVLPVIYGLIFIAGLILNGLATWIFVRVPSNSGMVVYLKNMVLADIIMLLSFPFRVASDLGFGGWELKLVVCRYTAVLFYLGMYTGIVFVSLISFERYMKIVHASSCPPWLWSIRASSFLQRVSVARGLAVLSWTLLLLCTLPNTILTNRPTVQGCSCMQLKSPLGRRWHEVSVNLKVAIFWVTLLVIVFCYYSIARHVYRSYQRVQRDGCRASRKSNRSIFSLLAVFIFCFVPYHICRVPYTVSQSSSAKFSTQTKYHLFQIKEATLLLSSLNVCLDPIVYFLMCRTFRELLLRKRSAVRDEDLRPSASNGLSVSNL